jgi:hypothetical protein
MQREGDEVDEDTCEYPAELQRLIDDFEAFSLDLICRVWDTQSEDALSCRDILRALPDDFESEPAWLQEARLREEAARASAQHGAEKTTYKDVLLVPKEERQEEAEARPVVLSKAARLPWRPRLVVTKDAAQPAATAATTAADEDDEDEREIQWMICCEGSRDAYKATGGVKRKAFASKLFVRPPEMDRRLKREALK